MSAILHDVGYAPRLAVTGFHPLDGARFLRDERCAEDRLVRLVANHTFALLLDALIYCDMTTAPDGMPISAAGRIDEIAVRYGPDSLVGRFIRRAAPGIFAAVARIEQARRV